MRKLSLVLLFSMMGIFASAQSTVPLSEKRCEEVIQEITRATQAMQTIQCRFVQSKVMAMLAEPSVSEGRLYYAAPDCMCWEFEKPYSSSFIVNGEQIIRTNDGKKEVTDTNSNRMFKGLSDFIMGSISGQKLFDKTAFNIMIFDEGNNWRTELFPLKRDMKRMFQTIVFRFEKKTSNINSMEMTSPNGDLTRIQFMDVVSNQPIKDAVFGK